jgi:hypothetical protein
MSAAFLELRKLPQRWEEAHGPEQMLHAGMKKACNTSTRQTNGSARSATRY